jgi:hypothetical protein
MTGFELCAYIGVVVTAVASGTMSLFWPEKVMAMRRRFSQSESWWSGSVCYSTPRFTRLTGLALLIVGVMAATPLVRAFFGAA